MRKTKKPLLGRKAPLADDRELRIKDGLGEILEIGKNTALPRFAEVCFIFVKAEIKVHLWRIECPKTGEWMCSLHAANQNGLIECVHRF